MVSFRMLILILFGLDNCYKFRVVDFQKITFLLYLTDLSHLQWRIYINKFWTQFLHPGQIFFIFMQFSGKFGRIIGCRPPWGILDPPPHPNHLFISNVLNFFACKRFIDVLCFSFSKLKCSASMKMLPDLSVKTRLNFSPKPMKTTQESPTCLRHNL